MMSNEAQAYIVERNDPTDGWVFHALCATKEAANRICDEAIKDEELCGGDGSLIRFYTVTMEV